LKYAKIIILKTSLEIPKLVFHQAHLVKYLSVVGQDWDPFHDYSLILFNKKALNECLFILRSGIVQSRTGDLRVYG
jgi:hypothetical protein